MSNDKIKELHGNLAKATDKTVSPAFLMNAVTMSNKTLKGVPIVDDENVEYASDFSKENKK